MLYMGLLAMISRGDFLSGLDMHQYDNNWSAYDEMVRINLCVN
jgi:hypothetical protein